MTCTAEDIKTLYADFPREDIHWRAQTVTKDGTKAMALAYVDARDVMERLDQACGAANWQDSYVETTSGRVICTISICIDDEWIAKSDGAGATAMEGEKGGLSDAFKRAAVKWGVGRYLYDLPAPWVPCESYEQEFNGRKKRVWKRWTVDPWTCVRGNGVKPPSSADMKRKLAEIDNDLLDCATLAAVNDAAKEWAALMEKESWPADWQNTAKPKFAARRQAIKNAEAEDAFPGDQPNGADVSNHPVMAG